MKKFFSYAMSLVMMMAVSFSTTGCSKDDVEKAFEYINAGMNIYNALYGGNTGGDVSGTFAGTAWAVNTEEGILVYSFETATTGKVILYDSNAEDVKDQENFTYQFGQYEDETYGFVIKYSETEQWVLEKLADDGSTMTINDGSGSVTFQQVSLG